MAVGEGSAWGEDRPQASGGLGGWFNDAMGGQVQKTSKANLGQGYKDLKGQMGESAKGAAANAAKWASRDMDIQQLEFNKSRAEQRGAIGEMRDAAGLMRKMAQEGDPAAQGMLMRGAAETANANMAALRGASAGAAQMGAARQAMANNAAATANAAQQAAEANTRARMSAMGMYGQQTGAMAGQYSDLAKSDAAMQAARMQAWLQQQQNATQYGMGAQANLAKLYGQELATEQQRLAGESGAMNQRRAQDAQTGGNIVSGLANAIGGLFSDMRVKKLVK